MRRGTPLALTLGEPAGIGPEIAAKAWRQRDAAPLDPFFLIGAGDSFAAHGIEIPIQRIDGPEEAAAAFGWALPVLETPMDGPITPGRPKPGTAHGVLRAIDRAVELVLAGRATGVVTNPIHKQTLYEAGFTAAGHTDYLAAKAGLPPEDAVMMLAVPGLRTVPLTVHVPLAKVPALITQERILKTVHITAAALEKRFALSRPRIVVTGLNPHAGEGGQLGREDAEIVAPAVAQLQAEGIDVRGPLAADTLFHPAARATYDAAVCMYHDQALIPVKTLDFERGVNVTLGLPFIRTSPDHGTALDIAGRGEANPASLIAALRLAGELAARRGAQAA